MGALSEAVVLNADGSLGFEEQELISAWLNERMFSYQPHTCREGWVPRMVEVNKLLKTGTSTLKRRYRGSTIRASAVVWGWLGRESNAGRLCSDVKRPRQGGSHQQLWQWAAMVEGGRLHASGKSAETQRTERLLGCMDRCAGIDKTDTGWIMGPRSTWQLMQMLRRHYRPGTVGVDLLSLDVALLVQEGKVSGDVLRRRAGGGIDYDWWDRIIFMTLENQLLISSQSLEALSRLVASWYQSQPLPAIHSLKRGLNQPRVLWVLDLFCGFRSLDSPVHTVLQGYCRAGDVVRCIGLDICERQIRGANTLEPDLCLDFLDYELPRREVVRAIATKLGLDLLCLVHVHASSPCDTNSRADASNRTRGCGYRDWHTPHCDPLHLDHTSRYHRSLAITHDKLERKLFESLTIEGELCQFCFGVENPVGAMGRKKHVQRLISSKKISRVTVDHCNYTPAGTLSYGKPTDYFVNFEWRARGQSGDGRCGKTGDRTGVTCSHGYLNTETNRWKHQHTIAQESTAEISGPGLHRRSQKNHLPFDECTEMLQASALIWHNRLRP